MSMLTRLLFPAFLVALLPVVAAAQSPTLPSDTLEANYAPRSQPGPSPELAPTLPSDTLDLDVPLVPPDSAWDQMRRDWDQGESGSGVWPDTDAYDVPPLRLGAGPAGDDARARG